MRHTESAFLFFYTHFILPIFLIFIGGCAILLSPLFMLYYLAKYIFTNK